jgi:exosortase E/protease (VPEID-CTERM system)
MRISWRASQRSALWIALLVGEGLLLGVRFDSGSLEALPPGWWTPLVDASGWLMPAAASVLAASLLLIAAASRSASASQQGAFAMPRSKVWASAHVACFAILFAVTSKLFDEAATLEHPSSWVAAWIACTALALGSWIGAALPPRWIARWLRTHATAIAVALALGACAFAVGRASQSLWLPLRRATFAASSAILHAVARDVIVDADALTLGVRDFAVAIGPPCSGYEGIGLSFVFISAALWLFRDAWRFPRAFALLAVGAAASFAANALRISALVLVGAYLSPQIGTGGFHSYAGTILFCATALGTVALALRSPWFARDVVRGDSNPAAPYLVPMLALVGAALVSRAFSSGESEPLFALRPLAALIALVLFARQLARLDWRCAWSAPLAGVAVALVWIALELALPAPSARTQAASAFECALRIATSVAIVPLVEELAFRGFLARRIDSIDFEQVAPRALSWFSVLASSIAFGLLHRRPIAGALAGVAYALIYRRSGRLGDAVVAHATTNAVLVAIAFASSKPELWM